GPLIFSSSSPSPFRKSIAVTILPRKLISPRTALPASGIRVIACSRITSCTSSTGIPYSRCPIQNVQNCRRSLTPSSLPHRSFLARLHTYQFHHVQQIRHFFLDHHRPPHPRTLRRLLQRNRLFHNVQNLLHHQPHRLLPVRVHNHLQRRTAVRVFHPGLLRVQHLPHTNQRHDLSAVLHPFPLSRSLHALPRKLLQPRHHRQFNRHPASTPVLKHQ